MANRRFKPFAGASVAFGSVGAGYGNLLASIPGRGYILTITNSLDADVWISLDGGTTDYVRLPAGVGISLDFGASEVEYAGTVSVKYGTGAPTSGFISCGVVRAE